MTQRVSPREIRERASEILVRHGIEEPPVPIELLAHAEGAKIARKPFDGPQSGFALRSGDGESWVIGVNSSTSARRQRFTIAHELGHLLLHEGRPLIIDHSFLVNYRDETSSMATDSEEMDANSFAAEILMPRQMVFGEAKNAAKDGCKTREEFIKRLSRVFDVSAEAMGYRLINLSILVP